MGVVDPLDVHGRACRHARRRIHEPEEKAYAPGGTEGVEARGLAERVRRLARQDAPPGMDGGLPPAELEEPAADVSAGHDFKIAATVHHQIGLARCDTGGGRLVPGGRDRNLQLLDRATRLHRHVAPPERAHSLLEVGVEDGPARLGRLRRAGGPTAVAEEPGRGALFREMSGDVTARLEGDTPRPGSGNRAGPRSHR